MNVDTFGIKSSGKKAVRLISSVSSVTVTIDPASIATVAGAVTADISLPGAAVGDRVNVYPPYNTQGVMYQGYVTAANIARISFFNPTGAAVDLASGAWTLQAIRR